MWVIPSAIFWGSAGIIAYTYAGYPLLINLLARLRRRDNHHLGPITPRVSVVLAAHDEARNIGAKLDNLAELDYPADRLEVIIVSDRSTDGTDQIVTDYAASHSGLALTLERLDEARGKPTALNRGVARARGEIVVFCDARQQLDRGALRALVAPFADPGVGAVSGELMMQREAGPGAYWAYEKLIRSAESHFDSTVGATGALLAVRRHLYHDLPEGLLLDDVYTPMQIAMQGFRVLLEPEARVFDREAEIAGEFSRKARTLAGNYQILELLPGLLDPRRNRLAGQYLSHKVLRLVCPFALGALYASNLVLVATFAPPWPLYLATLAGQTVAYGLALKGGEQGAGRLARLCRTFVVLNAAAVEGLRRYLKGDLGWTTVE